MRMPMKKDELGFMLLFSETLVAFIVCMIMLSRLDWKLDEQRKLLTATPEVTETPTFTPTPSPTMTPTPTPTPIPSPSPTPMPTPTPSPKPVDGTGHAYKPFTYYTSYNLVGSAQWKLQKVARTDERTGIRVVTDPEGNERYCVALGTYWAGAHPQHIGRCVDAVMVNGAVLRCVLGDVKKQQDTKKQQNKYGAGNNDVLEFIVDAKYLPQSAKICGNTSKVAPEFEGEVKELIVYDMWIDGFGK